MQLYRHAVSSRIGLGKLSTLPSVSDLGREEGGDWWKKEKFINSRVLISKVPCRFSDNISENVCFFCSQGALILGLITTLSSVQRQADFPNFKQVLLDCPDMS